LHIFIKMKKAIEEKIAFPDGVTCEYKENKLICIKGSTELSKVLHNPNVSIKIVDNTVSLKSSRANKNERKIINTFLKHVEGMFKGLNEAYTYKLEACNVHFPMSLKIEGDKLVISNFLGEKTPRYAEILQNVTVQIKGQILTVASYNKEAAGQTAANFERATIIKGRDRRIFQDGIFITKKPGDKKQ